MIYGKALICGKWELPFYVPVASEEDLPMEKRSYLHFIATRLNLISAKALCIEWLLENIPTGEYRCVEFFGGVGITTTILRNLVRDITSHTIYDLDSRCVEQLTKAFPDCEVKQGDAFEVALREKGDFFSLETPFFTANKLDEHRKLFDALLGSKPKYMSLVDASPPKFPLHKKLYGKALECDIVTPEDYLKGLSNWFYTTYGYSLIRVACRQGAYFCLLAPGKQEFVTKKFSTDKSGKGFKWIG